MAILITKLLSQADIESCLSFPTSSLGPLPFQEGHSLDMNVHDQSGQEWIFSCTIQRNDSVGQFLSVGWLEFVRHKNLAVNDEVIFVEEALENQAVRSCRIKIQVKRKIRLFGNDIWADV
ncbi:hypothetical protein MANES_10G124700v8 [Manihot esculenta]|uniref:TF-B3 domain-containing protein n=1 Tax=Manihot esculenta TaxID=3983 RepID=A0A2C9V7Q9_MANES|nr:hypothetical protein MANES_10G124700v8 [Manihot esculenta]